QRPVMLAAGKRRHRPRQRVPPFRRIDARERDFRSATVTHISFRTIDIFYVAYPVDLNAPRDARATDRYRSTTAPCAGTPRLRFEPFRWRGVQGGSPSNRYQAFFSL